MTPIKKFKLVKNDKEKYEHILFERAKLVKELLKRESIDPIFGFSQSVAMIQILISAIVNKIGSKNFDEFVLNSCPEGLAEFVLCELVFFHELGKEISEQLNEIDKKLSEGC